MACQHKQVLRTYNKEDGVNVSDNQPRVWVCQSCGKKSTDIQDFKVGGAYHSKSN